MYRENCYGGCRNCPHESSCWEEDILEFERARSEKLNKLFDLEEAIGKLDQEPVLTADEQKEMARLEKELKALERELEYA